MPPRGRKRKVGVAPAPEPGQVDDGDKTDDKEEEEAENNNEEAASSSTKKARVDSNAVHKEFNQTCVTKLVTTGKKQREVMDDFGIRHKVNYVCTDNGANIKKAMTDLGPSVAAKQELHRLCC